jgi:hypothetical protein
MKRVNSLKMGFSAEKWNFVLEEGKGDPYPTASRPIWLSYFICGFAA